MKFMPSLVAIPRGGQGDFSSCKVSFAKLEIGIDAQAPQILHGYAHAIGQMHRESKLLVGKVHSGYHVFEDTL